MPLFVCNADSEGGIGFLIQQALHNAFKEAGVNKEAVALVTQTVVDGDDTAFKRPTKPIGMFYSKAEAKRLTDERGWAMQEEGGRFRRVVPSPRPRRIVEAGVVKKLLEAGVVVIAAGGGGVPVVEDSCGRLSGVDAVVDKDYSTTLLGLSIGAKTIVNLTGVDFVCRSYGQSEEAPIHEMGIVEARRLFDKGEFPAGSMGPKIESAIEFVEGSGEEVLITSPESYAVSGAHKAGTRIVK